MSKLKARRNRLVVTVRGDVTRQTLARVLAFSATRDADGSYAPPAWTRSRQATVVGATRLLAKHGWDFFTTEDSWRGEIVAGEEQRALSAGQAVIARWFPEL